MVNTVVYETLVSIYYGNKKEYLLYKDYSDGVNLLFIELYRDDE